MSRKHLEFSEPLPVRIRTPKQPRTTMIQGKKRQTTKRECRVCGGDPWPNRFFCPTCHGAVSSAYVQ